MSAVLGLLMTAAAVPTGSVTASGATQAVPPGVTAGVAVFDRDTGRFTEQLNVDVQFRSASVVKLLITVDFLWDLGPDYDVPVADRARLDVMLRSSDDAAASYYWDRRGGGAIIDRMVRRLELTHTSPPPATHPGFWGYVAITAADTVRIYRYLLEWAAAPVREFVMSRLHQATRLGVDDFDQYFGIASVFEPEFSIKQGWSGFNGSRQSAVSANGLDLTSPALHTTGTVGPGDRTIVAVYTLHSRGTPYGQAYSDITRVTRSLDVPGGSHTAGTWWSTHGSGVRVRSTPSTSTTVLGTLPARVEVLIGCQKQGELVEANGRSSRWWSFLPKYGGYVTNVYVGDGTPKLPGVPDCQ